MNVARETHRVGNRRLLWLLAAVAFVVLPYVTATAGSAQEAPAQTAVPQPSRFDLMRVPRVVAYSLLHEAGFRDWEADLVFDHTWDRQDNSLSGGGHSRTEDMTFRERLHLANRGFVIDPRLFSFRLAGGFGLFQEQSSFESENRSSDGHLLTYDVAAVLLPEKPYTLTASAGRSEDVLNREFAGTTKVTREDYGASLTLRNAPLDSVVGVRQNNTKERLDSGPSSTTREERRTTASYHGIRLGEVSDLHVDYQFNDVVEQLPSSLRFQTHDGSASFRYFFGPYLEKDFLSRLRAFAREGDSSTFVGEADESLLIDHTEHLESTYDYSFLYNESDNARTLAHTGSAGVKYQIYSAATSLSAAGNYTNFPNGQTYGYGAAAGLAYSKHIPFVGRFRLGSRGGYRITDQTLPGGELFVPGERHQVNEFEPIYLDNPRVVQDSIVVTDVSGSIIYVEGRDYTVAQIGELTELQRVPGGFLQNGEVIVVEYRFISGSELKFSTLSRNVNVALDRGWASVYYQLNESDQSLLSGDSANAMFLDDITDQTAGVRLSWAPPRVQASALAEYRTYHSRTLAYDSPRASQSLSVFPARTLTFSATASESYLEFSNPADRHTLNVLGRLNTLWRARSWLFLDGFVSYLRLDDNVAPDERVLDTGVRLHLDYARLRITASVGFSRRDVGPSTGNEVHTALTIARKLW